MSAALFARRIRTRRVLPTAISTKTSPKHEFVGHQETVGSFVFLQDNVHIVSGSLDGTMCKWDCETGLLVGEPWKVGNPVWALALSPDGKTIACGRYDGSVQRWDTNGQMMEGIWMGHSKLVWSLSWSPSGCHLASGSDDGTILIRKAASGEVKFGPINTNQGRLESVAYSPSGDRIASGGLNISIWDSHTGQPLLTIQVYVFSLVWSLDGSKLYSGGDSTRIFDSTSGTELHRFQHDNSLYSIALSPKHNLLAGVGRRSIAQLWDTESYQPLGQLFHSGDLNNLYCVSFSPDGRYLAYSEERGKVTLRMVKHSAQELPVPQTFSINPPHGTQQEAPPKSPSPSCLQVDTNPLAQSAVKNDDECNDPYNTFFTSLKPSPPLPLHKPSAFRRLRAALSSRVPHHDQTKQALEGKSRAVNHDKECDGVNHSENVSSGTAECSSNKGKQREEPVVHKQICTPDDLSSPAELDNNENRALWKSLLRSRKKDSKDVPATASRDTSPAVVEVYATRVPKGHAVLVPKHKKKSSRCVHNAPTVPASGLSQWGPSSQGDTVHTEISSGGQARSSSQPIAAHPGQSRQVTSDDSHSDWSIQSPWQKFFDKLCYPCGH